MSEDKPVRVIRENYPDVIQNQGSSNLYMAQESVETEIHLLDYWRVLVTRRWTILAVVLTIVVGVMIWTLRQTAIYEATTTLQIDRENPNILNFKDVYELQSGDDDTLRTQYEVLKSRALAKLVIDDLKLDQMEEFKVGTPSFLSASRKQIHDTLFGTAAKSSESDDRRDLVDDYLARLTVTPVRSARLVNVSFRSEDPKLAATIVNAHSRRFIEQNLQFKFDATEEASVFLTKQLGSLKAKLEEAEDKVQQYNREHEILLTEDGHNTAGDKLKQFEEEHTKAEADRIQKEGYIRLIQEGNTDALPQLMNNQVVATSVLNLNQLQREDSQLAVTFASDYPSRKRIRNQIEEIQKSLNTDRDRVVRSVQAEYAASVERERLLAKAVSDQTALVNRINQELIQHSILQRDVDSNKQLYEGLLTRLKEAGISAGLRASNIRIVDTAEVPESSVTPRRGLNFALSLIAGLAFGIGLALFEEYLDSSIKSADEVMQLLNIPTLAIVPKKESVTAGKGYGKYGYGRSRKKEETVRQAGEQVQSGDKRNELVAHYEPQSLLSEAYRTVRTSLLLSFADQAPRTLLITSAVPSEGKTMTAANTAISLTQSGARVVLIDGDMRKPRIHKLFGISTPSGLSSFLTGALPLKDVIHPTQVPNLFVIPCGVLPPNPAELILSTKFKLMFDVLKGYFDYVVIDSPPLQNVSDGRIIATMTDAVVLVVKAFSTSRHAVKDVVARLLESKTRIAGVILNDFDLRLRVGHHKYYAGSYHSAYLYHGGYGSNYGSNYVDAAPNPMAEGRETDISKIDQS